MNISKNFKLLIKLTIRFNKDLITTSSFKFAKKRKSEISYNSVISISQEIKPSETFQNKVFNLSLASKKISEYEIMPNEIFSFWKIVGNPNNEFKKGRTLINGKIKDEIGGGICQVSGIVYYISVIAGLEILERYNHSVDIYTDETRFAPLGLDATVVYGYKDLRIKNNFSFPIKFEIKIEENNIKIELLSTEKIKENKLVFESEVDDNFITVNIKNENRILINQSKYKKY
jgi:vancomycin resistance protein VanW